MAGRRSGAVVLAGVVALATVTTVVTASASPVPTLPAPVAAKEPTAVGIGGAVASVDLDATKAGIEILRGGGNAVDAAVAAAATLGVTEQYSGGIGGGGFFVYYEAATGRVHTLDGRETSPARMREKSFIDPSTGKPMPFPEAVTSGLSVGVPGALAQWDSALRRWGSRSLGQVFAPAVKVADNGYLVDQTFRDQTAANEQRFRAFPSTRELFLPGGKLPTVGQRLRNPDLARTYRQLAKEGPAAWYGGQLGKEIVKAVQRPPVDPRTTLRVRPGLMALDDLKAYTVPLRQPVRSRYRGLDLYGMAPPSSGGTTVFEALNILERTDLGRATHAQALHRFLEASRVSFADRNRWVADPDRVKVPTAELVSDRFAAERACLIRADKALTSPVAPGNPDGSYGGCPSSTRGTAEPYEGRDTTHLTVADRWGNIVTYTFTVEMTGGSGIVVPGRGVLLNNELTDFEMAPSAPGVVTPNLPGPRKRPRSSMSPTLVFKNGQPVLALGSPGGATIITTVLQTLVNRIDLGMTLPQAVAAPRASQRNGALTEAEPAFLADPDRRALERLGHRFGQVREIGAVTGIEFLTGRRMMAVTEPVRRGGGSAMVVTGTG